MNLVIAMQIIPPAAKNLGWPYMRLRCTYPSGEPLEPSLNRPDDCGCWREAVSGSLKLCDTLGCDPSSLSETPVAEMNSPKAAASVWGSDEIFSGPL